MKQTSDRVSSIAARHARITPEQIAATVANESAESLAHDIRSMAASLLAQDEVRGIRKLWKKVTGQ